MAQFLQGYQVQAQACGVNRSPLRGGSWNNDRSNARVAYRNDNHRDNRNDNNGFRVVGVVHTSARALKPAVRRIHGWAPRLKER